MPIASPGNDTAAKICRKRGSQDVRYQEHGEVALDCVRNRMCVTVKGCFFFCLFSLSLQSADRLPPGGCFFLPQSPPPSAWLQREGLSPCPQHLVSSPPQGGSAPPGTAIQILRPRPGKSAAGFPRHVIASQCRSTGVAIRLPRLPVPFLPCLAAGQSSACLCVVRPRGAHRAKLCHCEPVTDVTGVAIRLPRLPVPFLPCLAAGQPSACLPVVRPRGAHRAKLCHCETVTDVTGVAIRLLALPSYNQKIRRDASLRIFDLLLSCPTCILSRLILIPD